MPKKLTPTMQQALTYARQHGGRLARYPGGYWSRPDGFTHDKDPHFGTNTIHGLVERGVARYSEEKSSRTGPFNTAIEIIDQ